MSEAEYASFAMPYNLKILESLPDRWWFNILQVQGTSPMLRLFGNLPVQCINWDTRDGHPDLSRSKSMFAQASSGGLSDWSDLHQGTPSTIQSAIREAIQSDRITAIYSNGRWFRLHHNADFQYPCCPSTNRKYGVLMSLRVIAGTARGMKLKSCPR